MALNIKNSEVERLAAEIAELTGETKTEAIRRALEDRRRRLSFQVVPADRKAHLHAFLEQEIWPAIPRKALGRRTSRAEEAQILGYGPEGV
jgi:antitoxin VapB